MEFYFESGGGKAATLVHVLSAHPRSPAGTAWREGIPGAETGPWEANMFQNWTVRMSRSREGPPRLLCTNWPETGEMGPRPRGGAAPQGPWKPVFKPIPKGRGKKVCQSLPIYLPRYPPPPDFKWSSGPSSNKHQGQESQHFQENAQLHVQEGQNVQGPGRQIHLQGNGGQTSTSQGGFVPQAWEPKKGVQQ